MKANIATCMDKVAQARDWMLSRLDQTYPWKGLTTLPLRHDGTYYNGTNILLLWMQQEKLQSQSAMWGSLKSFHQAGKHIKPGAAPQTAVYFSFVDAKPAQHETPGTSRDDPFSVASADRLQKIRVLKPIVLFNEGQTEEYREHDREPPVGKDIQSLIASFRPFCAKYLERWKAIPDNLKGPLTGEEELFLTRFAADILMVGEQVVHACDIPWHYPTPAIDSIADADAGRLMKLAGIAQEIANKFQKTGLSLVRKGDNNPFPVPRPKVRVESHKLVLEAVAVLPADLAVRCSMSSTESVDVAVASPPPSTPTTLDW